MAVRELPTLRRGRHQAFHAKVGALDAGAERIRVLRGEEEKDRPKFHDELDAVYRERHVGDRIKRAVPSWFLSILRSTKLPS